MHRSSTVIQALFPVLELAQKIKKNETNLDDLDKIQTNVFTIIQNIEKIFWVDRFNSNEIYLMKYALIVTLDELILGSKLRLKKEWQSNNLQLKVFGDNVGGEMFYVNIKKLTGDFAANVYIIQVYYLCLIFGFYGKFKYFNMEERNILIRNLQSRLYSKITPIQKKSSIASMKIQASTINNKVLAFVLIIIFGFAYYCFNLNVSIKLKELQVANGISSN